MLSSSARALRLHSHFSSDPTIGLLPIFQSRLSRCRELIRRPNARISISLYLRNPTLLLPTRSQIDPTDHHHHCPHATHPATMVRFLLRFFCFFSPFHCQTFLSLCLYSFPLSTFLVSFVARHLQRHIYCSYLDSLRTPSRFHCHFHCLTLT